MHITKTLPYLALCLRMETWTQSPAAAWSPLKDPQGFVQVVPDAKHSSGFCWQAPHSFLRMAPPALPSHHLFQALPKIDIEEEKVPL